MFDGREKEKEKNVELRLEYARGYRDALEDTWGEFLKMATKGYTSQELQIMVKSKAYGSKKKIDEMVTELENQLSKEDIIDAEAEVQLVGVEDVDVVRIVDLKPKLSYLVKETKPSRCFEMFQSAIAEGRPGLCIARLSPMMIREQYNIGEAQVIWLTMSEKSEEHLPPSALGARIESIQTSPGPEDEYVGPSNLPVLFAHLVNFLDSNNDGVVLMEGIEYLVSHNKFNSVLRFIQQTNEKVGSLSANLILTVNPAALEPRNYSLLERDVAEVV